MLSTIATDIKDVSVSADGKEASFVLVTKYSGDIAVSLPAICLQNLRAAAVPPSSPANPTGDLVGAQQTDGAKTTITVPKKWLVASDAERGLVIAILNHRLPDQYGFALDINAAGEFVAALIKQAEAVTTNKTVAASPPG
jgi:hypothetical protein